MLQFTGVCQICKKGFTVLVPVVFSGAGLVGALPKNEERNEKQQKQTFTKLLRHDRPVQAKCYAPNATLQMLQNNFGKTCNLDFSSFHDFIIGKLDAFLNPNQTHFHRKGLIVTN